MRNDEEIRKIVSDIRQTGYQIHLDLGVGYLEKVYENALRIVGTATGNFIWSGELAASQGRGPSLRQVRRLMGRASDEGQAVL